MGAQFSLREQQKKMYVPPMSESFNLLSEETAMRVVLASVPLSAQSNPC